MKSVKIIFGIRICLWIIAGGATLYWMYYSRKLYHIGVHDVYEYAEYFRPVFGVCLLITAIAVVISFILRAISDKIKKDNRGY